MCACARTGVYGWGSPYAQQGCAKTPGSPRVLTMAAQHRPAPRSRPALVPGLLIPPHPHPHLTQARTEPRSQSLTMLAPQTLQLGLCLLYPSSALGVTPAGVSCSSPGGEFGA